MNILDFIHNNLFIIWLIGAIVSFIVICKYVDPIYMLASSKYVYETDGKLWGIFAFIVSLCLIIAYTALSWIGAIVTYKCFYSDNEL